MPTTSILDGENHGNIYEDPELLNRPSRERLHNHFHIGSLNSQYPQSSPQIRPVVVTSKPRDRLNGSRLLQPCVPGGELIRAVDSNGHRHSLGFPINRVPLLIDECQQVR